MVTKEQALEALRDMNLREESADEEEIVRRFIEQSQPVPEGWQLQQEHREALIVAPDGSGAWYDEESTKDRIVRELVGALLATAPNPGGE